MSGRWIDVNLSQQRLTAYQAIPRSSARSSAAGSAHADRRGPLPIRRSHIHADERPGYDLPGVRTMYFYKGYAIHGTYWHNNFGRPMSHGCINMRTPDAAWLFNWASIGTLVVTHY